MKILLVDDHETVRKSLKQLIVLKGKLEVVGEAANGMEAVERVEQLRPDIVLMDVNMPVMNGVDATTAIKRRHPEVKVLALTAFADMTLVSSMVKAGASGYLLKGGSPHELIQSLQAIARGQGALDKGVTRGVMENMAELYEREQERADALAELDRMKSQFVSVVSHELRSPVTVIKGAVQTLRRRWSAIDEEVKLEFLESMSTQCDRLAGMISQILTVSGIQRGGLGLNPSTFSLADIARDALESLNGKSDGRVVKLRSADVAASGDRDRIKEVATALLDNALDHTSGSVEIEIQERGGTAQLRICDEGPGIDPATVERFLNEPFTQGDSSMTRSVGGLGLSLYIAKQVLDASGGRLEVDTSPDHGSRFTLVLPSAR